MPLRTDPQPGKAGAAGAGPRPAVPGEIEAGRRRGASSAVARRPDEGGGGGGGRKRKRKRRRWGWESGVVVLARGWDALSRLATVLSAAAASAALLSIGGVVNLLRSAHLLGLQRKTADPRGTLRFFSGRPMRRSTV